MQAVFSPEGQKAVPGGSGPSGRQPFVSDIEGERDRGWGREKQIDTDGKSVRGIKEREEEDITCREERGRKRK